MKLSIKAHHILHTLNYIELAILVLLLFRGSAFFREPESDLIKLPVHEQALTDYAQGNYRHALELLIDIDKPNDAEKYLIARCHYELEETNEAVSAFGEVNLSNLCLCDVPTMIPDNYRFFYARALLHQSELSFPHIDLVDRIAVSDSESSIYHSDVLLIQEAFHTALSNRFVYSDETNVYNVYIELGGNPEHSTELYDGWAQYPTTHQWKKESLNKQIRGFLRTDPDEAWSAILQNLKAENDFYWRYLAGMLYYEEKEYSDAYEQLLEVCLERPFTYEWYIAVHYENILRDDYARKWKTFLYDKIDEYWDYSLKERCYFGIAILYMDPDRFVNKIGQSYLKKILKRYETTLDYFLAVDKTISELEKLTNDSDFRWSREMLNYVEYHISTNSASKYEKRKYTYYYRELYHKMNAVGYIVNRLDTLMLSLLEDRRYFVILPDEILYELYPLVGMEIVLSNMQTTNRALWAISSFREESHFLKDALSAVGARGVAQIMPYTEDSLKLQLGENGLTGHDFADNIRMGSALHQYLFERYDENIVYALAAYNGGEGAINRWLTRYDYDTEVWVESILYDETRNYVRSIMESRMFYAFIYE